ncbi:hypothetical protein MIR68_005092 [Amoeboaphelidium protococcarum]|nr:hypothetical protein MIR68_005092 [Amoeboaphelidium protococcarum]
MPQKYISDFHSRQTQVVKVQVKGKRVPSKLSQRRIEGRRLSFCESSDPQDIINYAIESGFSVINLNGLELEQLPHDLASLNCLISYCPNYSFTPKIQLDLSWNRLNILKSSSVLWTISNLVYLDLSNNGLTYLPEEIAMLSKLETLVIRCNELQYLPVEMRDMKSLQRVNWFPNPLLSAEDQSCKTKWYRIKGGSHLGVEHAPDVNHYSARASWKKLNQWNFKGKVFRSKYNIANYHAKH